MPDEVINYIMINYSKQKGIISVENIQDNIVIPVCKKIIMRLGKKRCCIDISIMRTGGS